MQTVPSFLHVIAAAGLAGIVGLAACSAPQPAATPAESASPARDTSASSAAPAPAPAGDVEGAREPARDAPPGDVEEAREPTRDAPPAAEPASARKLPAQGEPCPENMCAGGLTCVAYYGIAGPRGPQFTSCEHPCVTEACPAGQSCITIADGPGQVCRPPNPDLQ